MSSYALGLALTQESGIVRLGAQRLPVNDVATPIINWTLNSASAATIPDSHASVEGAWFNTVDAIKSCRLALPGAGKLGAGSQLIVFGMNAA